MRMRFLNTLFRCLVLETLASYAAFLAVTLYVPAPRGVFRYFGAIAFFSIILLLAFSIAFLFVDRRKACRGFLVCIFGFIIGCFMEEL